MKNLLLNCVIVDDSSLQRLALVKFISDHPNLVLQGEFENAIDINDKLPKLNVDLVFLDVEMPLLSGFDLLDRLKNKPQVIFVTGKTQYAFKAFDYNAVDYLQKPVSKERFLIAANKSLNQYKLIQGNTDDDNNPFIFVKSNLKKRKVELRKLKYIEALGDYVKFVTVADHFVVLSTMKSFEGILPSETFLRIHKSYIVNLERVNRFCSRSVEIENEKLPLSRNKKTRLAESLKELQ